MTREAAAMLANPQAALFSGFPLQPNAATAPRAAQQMPDLIEKGRFMVREY
jgi:hypothetical protein